MVAKADDKGAHLRLNHELVPLCARYGLLKTNQKKSQVIAILIAKGVPLGRVQRRSDDVIPVLGLIENLGTEQIEKDFPPDSNSMFDSTAHFTTMNINSDDDEDEEAPGSDPVAVPDNGSRVVATRALSRIPQLPSVEQHAEMARAAGFPSPSDKHQLDDKERNLLIDYPVATTAMPMVRRALSDNKLKGIVLPLLNWFASQARALNISIPHALVFFDHYLASPKWSCNEYLLNKDNIQENWYKDASPSKKDAARNLSQLWSIALGVPSAGGTVATFSEDITMEVLDPYDQQLSTGKVIGKHMSKNNVLAVRLDSVSIQFPDLGRGLWVVCKAGKELEVYDKIKAKVPKLEAAGIDVLNLHNCGSPNQFEPDCVFEMAWGKGCHTYMYGRPKTANQTLQKQFFSKSTINKKWSASEGNMAFNTHLTRVGQPKLIIGDSADAQPETRYRSKRTAKITNDLAPIAEVQGMELEEEEEL